MSYGREYRRMVNMLVRRRGNPEGALIESIGGSFDIVGPQERAIVFAHGLREDDYLVDVGCGAGRLAATLTDLPALRYLGVDVVPELLAHATRTIGRPDWAFRQITSASLPLGDGEADMAVYFSVFTHLSERDILDHLREARRFLRPGGKAVFSFLDPDVPLHRTITQNPNRWLARLVGWARNVPVTKARIGEWAAETGFTVALIESPHPLGQSLAVFQKPA